MLSCSGDAFKIDLDLTYSEDIPKTASFTTERTHQPAGISCPEKKRNDAALEGD
jgi:hypothetical protein